MNLPGDSPLTADVVCAMAGSILFGRAAVLGSGSRCIAARVASLNGRCSSIDVIEHNQDAIDAARSVLEPIEAVQVFKADAYRWCRENATEGQYDAIFHDVWPTETEQDAQDRLDCWVARACRGMILTGRYRSRLCVPGWERRDSWRKPKTQYDGIDIWWREGHPG